MKIEQLEELIKIFDRSSLLEMEFSDDEVELRFSRKGEAGAAGAVMSLAPLVDVGAVVEEESYITSPIVSTFYPAPAPDSAPFVAVGDRVKIGQVVCILEAMKIMTEIKCEFECEIEAVLVSSGQKVEYGQPLFRVKRNVS